MLLRKIFVIGWLVVGNLLITASAELVSKSYFGDVAIGGHDTVYYHTEPARNSHEARQGDAYEFEWQGAVWKFASKESRDKFAQDPKKYAPAYNGFCANALSLGEGLIKTDGSVWEIFGDKLYLFYAERGRQRWLKDDYKVYKQQADKAWQDILSE